MQSRLSIKRLRRIGYKLSKTRLRVPLVWVRHRGLRASDVLLASHPRSGNTWLRFLLAEILTGHKIDFDNINNFIPELGRHRSAAAVLPASGRLIKTHEQYRSEYRKAVYLVRDVRDVALSNYARGKELGVLSNISFDAFLPSFLDGTASRVGTWQEHVRSWLQSPLAHSDNLLVIRFEDLRRDAEVTIQKLLDFFPAEVNPAKMQEAILNNSIARMRSKEDSSRKLPSSSSEKGRFVRTGSVAGWQQQFTERQVELVVHSAGAALSSLGYPITLPVPEARAIGK